MKPESCRKFNNPGEKLPVCYRSVPEVTKKLLEAVEGRTSAVTLNLQLFVSYIDLTHQYPNKIEEGCRVIGNSDFIVLSLCRMIEKLFVKKNLAPLCID